MARARVQSERRGCREHQPGAGGDRHGEPRARGRRRGLRGPALVQRLRHHFARQRRRPRAHGRRVRRPGRRRAEGDRLRRLRLLCQPVRGSRAQPVRARRGVRARGRSRRAPKSRRRCALRQLEQQPAKLARALRPPRRLLLERAQDELLHPFADLRVRRALAGRLRPVVHMPREHLHRVLPFEGQLAGGELVEDHADRVEIAAGVERAAGRLLGGHVLRRSADHVGAGEAGQVGVEDLGDAEVEHLHDLVRAGPALRDHDVLGLQVAVDHAARVRLRERGEHLRDQVDDARLGQRPLIARHQAQVLALHVLHRDVERAVLAGPPEVEHLDRVRVVEPARRLRFTLEAADQRRVLEQRRLEHLEADVLAEREVARPVDLAHPALADERLDAKAAGDLGAEERVLRARLRWSQAGAGGAGKAGLRGQRRLAARAVHKGPQRSHSSPRSPSAGRSRRSKCLCAIDRTGSPA